jgi:hypothetical protein
MPELPLGPVCWDLTEPGDAGVSHLDRWVEALGDGVTDESGAFLLEKLNQPLFLIHEPIDPLRLSVEEVSDGLLSVTWREWEPLLKKVNR